MMKQTEEKLPKGTERRRDKKKRKKLELEMEVLSETADRMAPIVGYFPSGYDPVAAGADHDVKVFRNKKRPNRLELVVRPGDANVEFVGSSYAGEAATPQLSTYALGVLDKELQTLKIIPIAANKILRLEPRFINGFGELPETDGEGILDEKKELKFIDLMGIYGTKIAKNTVKKWSLISQKRDDPSTIDALERGLLNDDFNDGTSAKNDETMVRNIPPYDSSATTPENAYPLDKIIPKVERDYLLDILETIESEPELAKNVKFWKENRYPGFVANRLQKLREMQDEKEKMRYACILSYITHLVNFRKVALSARSKSSFKYNEAMSKFKIPPIVFDKFMIVFLDPVSNMLSSEKNELLICHILVLVLFADNFRTYPGDIEQDLAITAASLKPYFFQLGCKNHYSGRDKRSYIYLSVPLEFQELKKRKKALRQTNIVARTDQIWIRLFVFVGKFHVIQSMHDFHYQGTR